MNTNPIPLNRPWIEHLFAPYVGQIGDDYLGYRNHVYRTVTYAMHFLGDSSDAERTVETAMVYHDIGLWSDRKLAYLEPSESLCLADNAKNGWGLNPELLRGIIHWHHKITPYRGQHPDPGSPGRCGQRRRLHERREKPRGHGRGSARGR